MPGYNDCEGSREMRVAGAGRLDALLAEVDQEYEAGLGQLL